MIILFGGNGFIGRHLAVAAGASEPVTIVSRDPDRAFFSKWAPSASIVSAEAFATDLGVRLLESAKAFVFLANHSVSSSNVSEPWKDSLDNMTTAFPLFLRVAEANPAIRIILASSGGTAYGEGHGAPIPETAPVAPMCAYGLSKIVVEAALAYVARRTGVDYAVLRISNPVGRWHKSRAQGLVEISLRKAIAGETLPILGDGSNIRDYFDADDLADAILRVARADGPLRGVWNVGSGRGASILEVVDAVSSLVGRRLRVEFAPRRPWDVSYSVLDAGKARADFGWTTEASLHEMIAKIRPHMQD